jgi:hypothetical protein
MALADDITTQPGLSPSILGRETAAATGPDDGEDLRETTNQEMFAYRYLYGFCPECAAIA